MAITRIKVIQPEPGPVKTDEPETAPQELVVESIPTKPAQVPMARVWLRTGKDNRSYGMIFTEGRPQIVTGETLIEQLMNDGNFLVETLDGGIPARTR